MNDRLAPALLLLAAWALAGCGNWSRDVAAYRTVLDGPQAPPAPAFAPADELPLVLALRLANADNETIASRGEDYIQALAEKMRAAGSFLPTVSLGPSHTVNRFTAAGPDAGAGGSSGVATGASGSTSHQTTVPLNASLTGSLANLSHLQASEVTTLQLAQLLLDARETVLLQVVQAYYGVLKAEQQAQVYEQGLLLQGEKVRDQEARLKLGSVRPLDLAQSQADLAGARAALIQSRSDAANGRSALARLIGVGAVEGPLSDAFAIPAALPSREEWQRQAAERRQDLRAAARAAEAARAGLAAAMEEYFPSLSINFNYFLYNAPASTLAWSSVFSVNLPLFSALTIEADVRKAWSVYRQAGLAQSQLRRQVADDVGQNLNNLLGSRERMVELRIEVAAAQRACELSERAYTLGSVSNLERLTQQDRLRSARLSLVSEEFSEKTAYLGLLRAAGRLSTVFGADPPGDDPAAARSSP